MVTTVDGKTLSRRWAALPGQLDAGRLFNDTADRLDAPSWLVGTTTRAEFAAARGGRLRAATVPAGDHTVVLTTTAPPPAYRAHLRAAGVSYLLCGPAKVDLRRAVAKLHERFGLQRLTVQGGGTLNGSMLRAGLVDEISRLLRPARRAGEWGRGGAGVDRSRNAAWRGAVVPVARPACVTQSEPGPLASASGNLAVPVPRSLKETGRAGTLMVRRAYGRPHRRSRCSHRSESLP